MSDADAPETTESEASAASESDLRIYKYLAPGALLALAMLQMFLGHTQNLTAWKGGGFGMFSTVDGPSARVVRVYLETPDREIPIRLPSWIRNREKYAQSFPAQFRLQSMADEMARAAWHYVPQDGYSDDGTRIEPPADSEAKAAAADPRSDRRDEEEDREPKINPYPKISSRKPGDDPREDRVAVAVNAVRIEVWRREYDRYADKLGLDKITELRVEVPAR